MLRSDRLRSPIGAPHPRACRLLALLLAALALLVAAPAARGQNALPTGRVDPNDELAFSVESPVGSIDYVAGRGLRLGRTGLTLGGFTTLEFDKKEGESGTLALDSLNLLVLWEPTDFFRAFAEIEIGDLLTVDTGSGDVESHPNVVAERVYGDFIYNDALNGRIGKFQTPVGIWNLVPAEPFTWTATDPLLVDTAFDEHQTGGAVFGTFYPGQSDTLDYWLYGQFIDPLQPSQDPVPAHRSIGGRARYGRGLGEWAVGASLLGSELDGDWNLLVGLDAYWQRGPFELQSEFAIVRGDIPDRNLWGIYLQGVYDLGSATRYLRGLHLVGRYEHWDPEPSSTATNIGDVGLTWIPTQFLIFKGGYRFVDNPTAEARRGLFMSFSVLF